MVFAQVMNKPKPSILAFNHQKDVVPGQLEKTSHYGLDVLKT